MTNLSELLPSGGGAKEFSVVASGTLASGQTVGLKANGTVEAIAETAEGLGAQTTFLAAVTDNYTCVYDSTADRFVLIYRTNSDFYYYGVVGERSGSTITFGTPQAVNTINQNNDARAVYDPTANRVLVFQNNPGGYGGGVAVTPATVTAGSNSISFATGQNFLASLSCTPKAVCYDPVHSKTFLLWRNGSASNYGYGSVFNAANPSTISIDSNTGTDVTGNNSMDSSSGGDCAFDTQRSRIAIVYQSPSSPWLRISSLTISSGSPSVTGMHQIDNNYYWNECHLAFDSSINRFLIIARSTTNVGYGWVAEMDASGTMTATSALTTFPNSGTNNQGQYSSVSSNNAGKWLVVSRNTNTGAIGSYYVVTDYLLAPVFSNATNALTSGSGNVVASSIAFDGSRFLFMMQAQTTSLSVGRVFNFLINNVSSFIGITGQAISDTATGKVNPQGGVATTQLPISAVYNSQSFSTASQDALPEEVRFKPDGTKFYILGATNDAVYQYSMSTAWDVSTASYESKSFSVQTQDTNPQGLAINADGTSFYMCGQSMSIYQYDLTTAYDASTASYASKSFSFSGQISGGVPWGIDFDSTGTKLYVIGSPGIAYQYTLSTAFDVSTASYASKSLDTTSQTSDSTSLALSSDGASLYVMSNGNDTVFKYTLSTPNDLATASYSGFSFTTTSQDTTPYGVAIKTDETQVYITGAQNDSVYQYSLSTSLTTGSTYYVQNDGSLSTTSSTVTAGKAISTTQLILNGAS